MPVKWSDVVIRGDLPGRIIGETRYNGRTNGCSAVCHEMLGVMRYHTKVVGHSAMCHEMLGVMR